MLYAFILLIRSGQLAPAPRSFAPQNNRNQVESNLIAETDRRSSIQPQPRQQPQAQPRQFRQPPPRPPQPVARARSRPRPRARAQSPPCDLLCAIARIFGLWRNKVLGSLFRSFIHSWFILSMDELIEFCSFPLLPSLICLCTALDLKIFLVKLAIWDCNSIWDSVINTTCTRISWIM